MLVRLLVIAALVFAALPALAQDAKIKAGDVVRMTCEEEPTLNKEYTVSSEGMLLVDFLGAVKVEGLTEKQAAKEISDRLVNERILRRATITLKIVNTTVAPVTYRGAVKQTGQEPYKDGLRLADIVRKAQPRDDTDLSRVEVRSKGGDINVVNFAKYDPGSNANNPLMQPGDVVTFFVKNEPGIVVLLGGVERPGGVTWEPGMTVRSAIEKAGGLVSLAVNTAVRLERDGSSPQTLDLSRSNVDAAVKENDRIIVPMREKRDYITVSGAVAKGGFIEYKSGMTLTQAIEAGGGLRPDANPNLIRLTRSAESKSTVYKYDDLKAGRTTDPVLYVGDKVMVDMKSVRKNDLLQSLTMLALLYILIGR